MEIRRIRDRVSSRRSGSLTAVTSLVRNRSSSPLTAAILVALYPSLTLAQRATSDRSGPEEIVVTADAS
jgi:hypothetical protein